ncbi:MAG: hypothetical protein C0448_07455 [Sphingobacteriaceae bacterium]|nr:hypothetical protein [Sphingobacteriaceae bacterium]
MIQFKIKQLKPIFIFVLIINFIFINASVAQDATSLNVGDTAPALVLNSTDNAIQSFTFPHQNKVVLVFFWSSTVSKSKENIYKYKRLYAKYSSLEYKSCDGFDMISVALQSDKVTWAQDLIKYRILDINNCISLKGYNDFFVRAYKIKETPSSFLIDENGKIIAINPPLKSIISYLDERRNLESQPDVQTKLSGKIMFGNNSLAPFSNEKIWFINGNNDTIKTVTLDEKGKFFIDNVNTAADLHVFFPANTKISDEQTPFLTSDNGEIISAFTKNEVGYEYKIMDVEMPYLKPLFNDNKSSASQDKSLKNLNTIEKLFKAKEVFLSKESMAKLNVVIAKLKENPKTRLEIISHTDSNGDAKANTTTTLAQSNSIVTYLVSKGIAKSRLKATGKGEDEILNKCKDGVSCLESEHANNRRTEFKFYTIQ